MVEGCFGLILAVGALVCAALALSRANRAQARLARLEDMVSKLSPPREEERTTAAALAAAKQSAARKIDEPVPLLDDDQPAIRPPAATPPTTPPPVVPPKPALSPTPAPTPPPLPASSPPSTAPPPRRVSLEERIGVRLYIWAAALALAVAGASFVAYSYRQGLLSPAVRITIACIFGAALIATGELLRKRLARIAQALVAAGIATLFAALLAGVRFEHVIPQTTGFVAMAVLAAAAVVLSLRHGQLVALLGLVGGLLTPAFIGPRGQDAGTLFGYLFLLEVALLATTRSRRWWALTALTLLSGYAWAGLWMTLFMGPGDHTAIGLFVLGTAAAFAIAPMGAAQSGPSAVVVDVIRWCGAAIGLVMAGVLLAIAEFTVVEWVYLGIIGAGCMALERFDRRQGSVGLAWLGAASGATFLAAWVARGVPTEQQTLFAGVALTLGAVYAGGAYALLWRSGREGIWASLSVASALAYLLVGYIGWRQPPGEHFWGLACLGLAGVYAIAAAPFVKRRSDGSNTALAALAVGCAAMLSLAVPIELERQWISVAWTVLTLAIAGVHAWLRVPALRIVAAVLASLVLVRLVINPMVLTYPIGTTPIVNWLLYGYGIPIVAFVAAAWVFRRSSGPDWLSILLEGGAVALTFALVTLECRHFFHRDKLSEGRFLFNEVGTYANLWLAITGGLTLVRRWRVPGGVLAVIIGALALGLLGVAVNPMWTKHAVGSAPVFNWLLYVYGLPAVLLLIVAWMLGRTPPRAEAGMCFVLGLLFLFALITLQVRQAFHGADLQSGGTSHAEHYAYSAAWLAFGAALLVAGIVLRNTALRWASLAVIMLTTGKVFIWDMAHLRDLLRVLSFLGLGIVLLALAFLYQRFVFPRSRSEAA